VRFADQRCGVERLARLLPGHLHGGQLAQLAVDERQQFCRSVRIAGLDGGKYARDLVHEVKITVGGQKANSGFERQKNDSSADNKYLHKIGADSAEQQRIGFAWRIASSASFASPPQSRGDAWRILSAATRPKHAIRRQRLRWTQSAREGRLRRLPGDSRMIASASPDSLRKRPSRADWVHRRRCRRIASLGL